MGPTAIAVDVMGGDRAPGVVLDGALLAWREAREVLPAERIVLVGDEERIAAGLAERGGDPGFGIVHAAEVIGMHEKPGQALRAKPRSSIALGVGAVKGAAAGAFVSMGNTGAVVGAATLGLGTLPGVRRPGIAVTLELTGSPVTILDMGANVVPKPQHLVQYAVMGSAFLRDCHGVQEPRVGLLNIGEEASKGTDLLRAAHELLETAPVDFVGNVEGSDLFRGSCDVLVTDGFTGNVALKLMEGLSGFMLELVLTTLGERSLELDRAGVDEIRRHIDYSEYGGALLLGVDGVVVIGHGRSDERAVANALSLAARALDVGVNQDIVRGLEGSLPAGVDDGGAGRASGP